jgi:glycosyltransferase involved in cell wall biosynthesis
MKIGIDCRLWNETGIGRYTRNLVLNLQRIDKNNKYVLFVLSKDKEEIKSTLKDNEFKLVDANIKWHTLDEQINFPQLINQENLDLMHFPYFSVPIFYNRPFVVTVHDLIMNHFSTGHASTLSLPIYNLKLLAYKFVLNQSAKNAKRIIAVSNATRDEIVDHLKIKIEKITVTCEGIDDKILNFSKPSSSEIKNKLKNYFLYVGNVFPHKNIDRLLKAFKMLDEDINLVLVGKEDFFYKKLKEKVKNMNLDNKIFFCGKVTDIELGYLYKNSLGLIMPSLMEGFGLPALEAMANNCLVLASEIPSLKEICEDVAIYFDPYSVNSIMEKIKEVSNDPSKFTVNKEKGLQRVKKFSWTKMAEETLSVYESCISLRQAK